MPIEIIGIPISTGVAVNYRSLTEAPTVITTNMCRKKNNLPINRDNLGIWDHHLTDGLSRRDGVCMNHCVKELYEKHQSDLVSMAFDKLLKDHPDILESGYFTNETKESLSLMKDKFEVVKISANGSRKISCWYRANFVFKSNTITFDGSVYYLNVSVLVREKRPHLDFHVIDVDLRAERRNKS